MSAGTKYKALMSEQPAPKRHPSAAFPIKTATWIAKDREYPRAGVRLQADGKWLRLLWYAPALVRIDAEPLTHDSLQAAFLEARRDTHAARSREHPAGQVHLSGAVMEPTA